MLALLVATGATTAQEEKKVPKDSVRVFIPGCAYDRAFIVSTPPEAEPVRTDIVAGRRFRLNGKKDVLNDIKARQTSMLEITGIIRRADIEGPGGIRLGGGRVRIGGEQPRVGIGAIGRDPGYSESIIDVESYRMLPATCPKR